MLSYLLGWTVGLGSLGLYLTGFLLPETRRKNDAIWSGAGLIYALSILADGDRIPDGLQIGQFSGALLLGWLGWQTLQQRRQLSEGLQTPIPASVQDIFPFVKQGWNRLTSTYKSPIDDGSDVLVTGVKKVSALIGGSDASDVSVELPDRFKSQVSTADLDEDENWAEGGSPAVTVIDSPLKDFQPDLANSRVDLPSRYSAPADESLPESAGVEVTTPTLTGPDSSFSPSVVVPQESATTEVKTDIFFADSPPMNTLMDLNPPSSAELDPVEAQATEGATQDTHPELEAGSRIDAGVIEETPPLVEAMPSDPDPETEPSVDLSDRSVDATTVAEKDEDWPPKDSTI